MRRVVYGSLSALALAFPLLALGADNPDHSFFKRAAESGIAEVEAGKLAQDKGSSQAVKDFGAMMVSDHTAANDKLKGLASSENVSLPSSSSVSDMAAKGKLEVLTGTTFDKAYIKNQLKAHQQAVALFKKESTSGQDAQAKAFAAATLPTLRAHLKKVHQLAAESGVSDH